MSDTDITRLLKLYEQLVQLLLTTRSMPPASMERWHATVRFNELRSDINKLRDAYFGRAA